MEQLVQQSRFWDDVSCPIDANDTLSLDQLESLFNIQREVLESALLEPDGLEVIRKICLLAEDLVPDAVASMMLLDQDKKLNVYCAPSIPKAGIELLNGLVPGPNAGSCGNVIYRQQATFVSNIADDPRWADLNALAQTMGLGSCWSVPVQVGDGQVIGTFALTSFEPRPPSLFHRRILNTCTYLIGIVLSRQKMEEQLLYTAYNDRLTGLPNRDKLELDIDNRLRNGLPVMMVLIGLNRFKTVNDTYGHAIGDQVLRDVGIRLTEIADTYRVTSDEFALVKQGHFSNEDIAALCQMVADVLKPPVKHNNTELYTRASVGVAQSNQQQKDSFISLIQRADTAMHEAKISRNIDYVCFSPEMTQRVEETHKIESDLYKALERNEFRLYYQPVVSSSDKSVCSLEALIRWEHPERGLVPPNQFIPLAEENGLINRISLWVVGQAIADLKARHENNQKTCKVSINLSGREFNHEHVMTLVDMIEQEALTAYFEFELLESYLMQNAETVISLMNEVRSRGISISIDDFGTGYSSFAYLKQFPIDKIKIDQSLIKDITEDNNDLEITKAIVAMTKALNLQVVTEGVETERHCDLLAGIGVDFLQGYYFSRPVPKEALEVF